MQPRSAAAVPPAVSEEGRDSVRVDTWLWRARFFKSRSLAGCKADQGLIRLRRADEMRRIDKASRSVRIGDELTFAVGARVIAVRIKAFGERRGPPAEARNLYELLDTTLTAQTAAVDKTGGPPR